MLAGLQASVITGFDGVAAAEVQEVLGVEDVQRIRGGVIWMQKMEDIPKVYPFRLSSPFSWITGKSRL